MSGEMWGFVALLLFLALVPVASYWFVLLPDHWSVRRRQYDRDGEGDRQNENPPRYGRARAGGGQIKEERKKS